MKKITLLLLAAASLLSTDGAAQEMNAPATKVSKIFDRELPNVPGKSMRAVLVEYGPGAASPSHRHPSSAFIYATVLEGEIRAGQRRARACLQGRRKLDGDARRPP